jgi:hypothetical protein
MKEATDATLTKTERNCILGLVDKFGPPANEFVWSTGERHGYLDGSGGFYTVSILTHRPTGFYCIFGGENVTICPGVIKKVEDIDHEDKWATREKVCVMWLGIVRQEAEAPDLWAALQYGAMDRLRRAERANDALTQAESQTAASELREANVDLSRQPPDLTGSVQHSLAALECVAREHCSDHATFGKLLQRYDDLFPKPLDKGIEKIWGFASEMGRHLQEGRTPSEDEAELLVGLATVCCTYLARKGRPVG